MEEGEEDKEEDRREVCRGYQSEVLFPGRAAVAGSGESV